MPFRFVLTWKESRLIFHPSRCLSEITPHAPARHPAQRTRGDSISSENASTPREIDAAFATLVRERLDALFLAADPFFTSRRVQLANLATRHVVPMISATREVPEAGGLISYGANINDGWRLMGVYVGRILRGTKPADLPVVQSTKFELVINAQTARILGLEVPASLLARADEVMNDCNNETPRVHHSARRCGRVAARGARAAARESHKLRRLHVWDAERGWTLAVIGRPERAWRRAGVAGFNRLWQPFRRACLFSSVSRAGLTG